MRSASSRGVALPAEPVAEDSPSTNGMVNQRGPGGLTGVEHRQDVGMLEPGGELDLALEPLGAEGDGELGKEHLERDLASCLRSRAR